MNINPSVSSNLFPFLGLIILAVAVIFNTLLALLVRRNNPQSVTAMIFLLLSSFTSGWLIVSYVVRFPIFSAQALGLARLGIFFAAPMSALFFLLAHTLPAEKLRLSRTNFLIVLLATFLMMGLNLSPYGFTAAKVVAGVIQPQPGWGFLPFTIISTLFSVLAVFFLVKRCLRAHGEERQQLRFVLIGLLLMLSLIIGTVLIPIIFFESGFFVSLTPVYALLFFGLTAYAIVQHHLFNIKVLATEALVVLIGVLLLARVLVAESSADQLASIVIFAITVFLGFLLTRSVQKEVKQREKLQLLTKELEASNFKLKELDQLKSEFLSFASHQVKAPLAAIKGFATLILDGTYGETSLAVEEAARKIKNIADRLIVMVNNILNLRKIEEGKMEYQWMEINWGELIREVAEELKPLALEKGLMLNLKLSDQKIIIEADREKLRQVTQNLLENAIKYSGQGEITLELKTENKNSLFKIKDSGRGIPSELLPHLFGRFKRGRETAEKIEGTGLGLYIAKQIVVAHQGEIEVESKPGEGSVFTVKIPLAKPFL